MSHSYATYSDPTPVKYADEPSRMPSREAFLAFRQKQVELGFEFPLTASSVGKSEQWKARVRRLSLMDRASIDALPSLVQAQIWEGLKVLREETRRRNRDGIDDPESLIEVLANNERVLPAADAFCIASFIDPPLVYRTDELNRFPNAYLVTDIRPEDRVSFFLACSDADSEAAKKLKLFRPDRESPIDVEPAPTRTADAPITFGDHRADGGDVIDVGPASTGHARGDHLGI